MLRVAVAVAAAAFLAKKAIDATPPPSSGPRRRRRRRRYGDSESESEWTETEEEFSDRGYHRRGRQGQKLNDITEESESDISSDEDSYSEAETDFEGDARTTIPATQSRGPQPTNGAPTRQATPPIPDGWSKPSASIAPALTSGPGSNKAFGPSVGPSPGAPKPQFLEINAGDILGKKSEAQKVGPGASSVNQLPSPATSRRVSPQHAGSAGKLNDISDVEEEEYGRGPSPKLASVPVGKTKGALMAATTAKLSPLQSPAKAKLPGAETSRPQEDSFKQAGSQRFPASSSVTQTPAVRPTTSPGPALKNRSLSMGRVGSPFHGKQGKEGLVERRRREMEARLMGEELELVEEPEAEESAFADECGQENAASGDNTPVVGRETVGALHEEILGMTSGIGQIEEESSAATGSEARVEQERINATNDIGEQEGTIESTEEEVADKAGAPEEDSTGEGMAGGEPEDILIGSEKGGSEKGGSEKGCSEKGSSEEEQMRDAESEFGGEEGGEEEGEERESVDEEEQMMAEAEILAEQMEAVLDKEESQLELEAMREQQEELWAELEELRGVKEEVMVLREREEEVAREKAELARTRKSMADLIFQKQQWVQDVESLDKCKKEIHEFRARERELQRQLRNSAATTHAVEIQALKQVIVQYKAREEEVAAREAKALAQQQQIEMLRKALEKAEVEGVELRRASNELQLQKRKMSVQLQEAQAHIDKMMAPESAQLKKAEMEAMVLRQRVADLLRQVEGLQNSRFSEVEEVVYLRWVNACLRFELRNFKSKGESAISLNRSRSPKSQELAKQLMANYAAPDVFALAANGHESRDEWDEDDDDYDSSSAFDEGQSDGPQRRKVNFFSGSSRGEVDGIFSPPDTPKSSTSALARKSSKDGGWIGPKEVSPVLSGGQAGLGVKGPLEMKRFLSWKKKKGPASESSVAGSSAGGKKMIERTDTRGSINSIDEEAEDDWSEDGESNDGPGSSKKSDRGDGKSVGSETKKKGKTIKVKSVMELTAGDAFNMVRRTNEKHDRETGGNKRFPAFKDRHQLAQQRQMFNLQQAESLAAERRAAVAAGGLGGIIAGAGGDKKTPRMASFEKRDPRVPSAPPKPKGPGPKPVAPGTVPAPIRGIPGAPPLPPAIPPLPPMLAKGQKLGPILKDDPDGLRRAPEVVAFYQSLMRMQRAALGPLDGGKNKDEGGVAGMRGDMIGEIEARSTHLLAIKHDVEVQADFVNSLAKEVKQATLLDIDDVVDFVKWLDNELAFLVDERAVLKHFDWPEAKADAMREAAFEYQDLAKLEKELTEFDDDQKMGVEAALKKMLAELEKVEQSIYALLRTRDMTVARYNEFGIPTYWISDTGLVGKARAASVRLARLYMARLTKELDKMGDDPEKELLREFLLLQGVRFAFRTHQFAGGFDAESMKAFETLRARANSTSS